MAEGLARALSGGRVHAFSAGTEPKPVHPLAVEAMAEIGIDISAQSSKRMDRFLHESFDLVVSVCQHAAESCPVWPRAAEQLRWSFDDPAAAAGDREVRLRVFRRVRDEIRERLSGLFAARGLEARPQP
jgi:protein-tyrosine-phosphatase